MLSVLGKVRFCKIGVLVHLFRVFESSACCKSAFLGHWLNIQFVVKWIQVVVQPVETLRAGLLQAASLQVQTRLTKRAPDVWDSAAFSSIFLASSFSCSQAESTPAHTQVTQTVSPFLAKSHKPFVIHLFLSWLNLLHEKTSAQNMAFTS